MWCARDVLLLTPGLCLNAAKSVRKYIHTSTTVIRYSHIHVAQDLRGTDCKEIRYLYAKINKHGEGKMQAKSGEDESANHNIRKKYCINIGLLKRGFKLRPPKVNEKCSKCPPLGFTQTLQETGSGTLISSSTSDWGSLQLPRQLPPRAVERSRFTHDDTPPHFLLHYKFAENKRLNFNLKRKLLCSATNLPFKMQSILN